MSTKTAFVEEDSIKQMAVGFEERKYWCLEEFEHLGILVCDCSILQLAANKLVNQHFEPNSGYFGQK